MSKYTPMLLKEKERFKSLRCDLDRFSNKASYYLTYNIPEDEKMLVYAYSSSFSSFSMEGNGTIITDRAIYFHPTHSDWAPKNRVELDGLCGFYIYQENSLDNVHLLNQNSDIRIFGRTVAPNDTTGRELVELLRALQREMASHSSLDRQRYADAEGFILDSIGRSFRSYGVLLPLYETLLDELSKEGVFPSMTAVYQAENLYRHCDMGRYHSYVDSIKDSIDEKLYLALKKPDDKFFLDYIDDLSDVNIFTFTTSLLPVYSYLKGKDCLTGREAMILLMISTYIDDSSYVAKLHSVIKKDLPFHEEASIVAFLSRSKNEKMAKIYDKLLSGGELSEQELEKTDSLGFDALHYAIMLKDKDILSDFLTSGRSFYEAHPRNLGKMADLCYDYFLSAALLYDDIELLKEVYVRTRRPAGPLYRSIKRLEKLSEINEAIYIKSDGTDKGCLERITELNALKTEISDELTALIKAERMKAIAYAKIIFESKHTFACFLMSVIYDMEKLFSCLAETDSFFKVFYYRDLAFVTTKDTFLDLDFVLWNDGAVEETSFNEAPDELKSDFYEKLYDNPAKKDKEKAKNTNTGKAQSTRDEDPIQKHRFFSDLACTDILVLKKEYHELIKRYHPDVTGSEKDAAIIRAVIEERAEILERFST